MNQPAGHEPRDATIRRVNTIREEYDFSRAEHGKFHRPDAELYLPVYLDNDALNYFEERARNKGVALTVLINDLLRKDIALIEGVK